MSEADRRHGWGLVLFRAGMTTAAKVRGVFFFILFCLIIAAQACYWLFANSVEPVVLGMPFGMFAVVVLIGIEFVSLLFLYYLEDRTREDQGTSS